MKLWLWVLISWILFLESLEALGPFPGLGFDLGDSPWGFLWEGEKMQPRLSAGDAAMDKKEGMPPTSPMTISDR